jgi:hypothetical protein
MREPPRLADCGTADARATATSRAATARRLPIPWRRHVDLLGEPGDGPKARGRSRLALVAAVALVVVVAAAVAFRLWPRPAPSPGTTRAPKIERTPDARATPRVEPSPLEREAGGGPARPRPAPTATAPTPRFRVDADVPGASVFLDRKYLGTTPVETTEFTPGSHRLNVSAEGQDMYAETIEVPAGGRDVVVRFKEVRLDEAIDVVHRHGVGSCRGRLAATPAGLAFSGGNAEDAFQASFSSLEPLQVDYLKKNLRVRVKGGKTYNFSADSADALLVFQKAVEAARKKL